MAIWLREDTAVTIVLGPFVDPTTPETEEEELTINQAAVRLSKNGGAFAQKNDATTATHMENGFYSCPLNATDTSTPGSLVVAVDDASALIWWKEYHVVPQQVWDSFLSTDRLQVHAAEISNDLITAAAIANGAIDAATFAAGAITATVIATDAIDADALATDAVAEIQTGLSTFDHTTDQVLLTTATQDQINTIESSFVGVGIPFTTTGTPSTTSVSISGSDLGDTTGDHNRQYCFFTSGGDGVIGIGRWITTFTATGEGTGTLAFSGGANDPDGPLPNAPAAGVSGRILGRR